MSKNFLIKVICTYEEDGVSFECVPSKNGELTDFEEMIYNATFHQIKKSLITVTNAIEYEKGIK